MTVEGAGGLVEDEDGGVPQHCSGNRQPLSLPAADAPPALADAELEPLLGSLDEGQRLRLVCGKAKLLVAGRKLSDHQILLHSTIKHQRFLIETITG